MQLEDCYIGQRVQCVKPLDGNKKRVGEIGTIIAIKRHGYQIAVEFDRYIDEGGQWKCYNLCPSGLGRFGSARQIEPIEESIKLDMSIAELF